MPGRRYRALGIWSFPVNGLHRTKVNHKCVGRTRDLKRRFVREHVRDPSRPLVDNFGFDLIEGVALIHRVHGDVRFF